MTTPEDILNFIKSNPGKKAYEIGKHLHLDKKSVNSILYGPLRGRVTQDNSYKWWPKEGMPSPQPTPLKGERLDTPLANLCRYYLECISRDDQGGLSVFASSSFGNLDYAELSKLPQVSDDVDAIFEDERSRRLSNRIRMDRNRLNPVLGYPVCLTRIRSKKGWEGFLVQPIFLFRFEEGVARQFNKPILAAEPPQINFEAIRSLSSADRGMSIVEEIVQLSEDLGLANAGSEPPDIEELIPRLREIRPEWDWREEPDPYNLAQDPAISKLGERGIYNRAVLVGAERSPYTKGLETELAKLQAVSETEYHSTALGSWLSGHQIEVETSQAQALLEVLPLNSEQRQAVLNGLNNQLTVITGPPGTGKSQVVTSLLINAAWQGKTVLFASKNNKAVDVVETRINSLGTRPVLLRLGAGEFQSRVSEYLISLLAASASEEDEQNYRDYLALHDNIRQRFQTLETQLSATLRIRNEVDRLEQSVELIRQDVGSDVFELFRTFDHESSLRAGELFSAAVKRADRRSQGLFVRVIWGLVKSRRYAQLGDAAYSFQPVARALAINLPQVPPADETIEEWTAIPQRIDERIRAARKVRQYFDHLAELTASKPVEDVSREQRELVEELAQTSDLLWNAWLRLQPKRLSHEDRKVLREYGALLKLIVAANEEGRQLGSQIFARYHALFPKITKILPCWAVTSLAARGRIPFEPEFFDLLVVDEASQCDIASALPLLFRARRAVIIGDPKQLQHISSLPKGQDRQLLANYRLVEGDVGWAYSVNSLFDLASGLCRSEDIVELRDHHRSHADIIEFSNQYFYDKRLRVATKYDCLRPPDKAGPAVRWLNVNGSVVRPSSGGALNEEEAKAVVKEIERLVLHQGYVGTIGVVSPFRAQANRIRDLVYQDQSLGPRIAPMEFLVDTVHRFQGDERDLIIFSPVVSARTPEGAMIFLRNNPNLFNVAVTRARAALVVVGDRQAALNSGIDYLVSFAKYTENLGKSPGLEKHEGVTIGPDYPPVAHPERVSEWERIFYRAVYARGLRPIPQYDVEKYTLDFALLDGHRKLDVEIDGERYHRNWDGELCRRDQIRNQRLFELGWDVMRFWVYQIRDDLDGCIRRMKLWSTRN
jgi:very-short-patch-repair endonuclease